ncbi:uncharacterized protein LOC122577583 [Bombus pyrosoma]|uniref:uncharacterized protein LOC122577583 n=1 Tax=Bombus pyrosoma TaxID=396416 RepID=UPI001CB92F06|nr:uncharacterized protein LOC122577583 [Bombus pyrosoma]
MTEFFQCVPTVGRICRHLKARIIDTIMFRDGITVEVVFKHLLVSVKLSSELSIKDSSDTRPTVEVYTCADCTGRIFFVPLSRARINCTRDREENRFGKVIPRRKERGSCDKR